VKTLRELGVTAAAIKDAVQICALFNLIDRVADALGFEIPSERGLTRSAKVLLWRGYN
jgi:alkylhydroperoxidase family enzyme